MNSYGDSSSPRGRAQIPGSTGFGSEADEPYLRQSSPSEHGAASYEEPAGWPTNNGFGSAPPAPPTGRAVAAASIGGASVGRATVGRASVPAPGAPAYGDQAGAGMAGGAATGRATVGRATVRPVSPGDPSGPGRPGGPSGPGGPGGRGPGGRGPAGRGPAGRGGKGDRNDPAGQQRAKRRRRINLIIAAFAVFIMLAGGAVVGFTYYSTNVTLPENVELPLATTIFYADGKTQLAKVGEVNRELVKIDKIPDYVQKAVASAEDRKFYEHGGVDYVGIMRAAWNNFTGGDTQGASTITQQYARNAMDLGGVTYARKVREAVLASKLNDRYAKSQIMEMYLNTIYFGRGAYGIEAAAKAYFNVPASKLTVEQGAVLAAVIKQPRPDPATGHKGYDPADNPEAAKTRWDYVLDGMVQKFGLDPAKRAAMQYPKAIAPPKDGACLAECGLNTPAGMAINYITKELVEKGICQEGHCMQELREGGYKIETSLDPKMQRAAEQTVSRKEKGSEIAKQRANLMAALVSIDPNTGRVLAYFGGNNNSGHDYAGKNWENGQWTGGHPAGSTFKVYTLAAALDAGIGLQSHWDAKPFTVKGTEIKVQNAGRDVSRTCGSYCTLEYSTLQSYNVPFYYVTEKIGPDRVVDMAKRAGITMMWNTYPSEAYDLTQIKDAKQVAPAPFFNVVGYGQYPITVIDHANGVATLAARGMYHKAHFVVKVWQKDRNTGQWVVRSGEKVQGERRIREEVADNVNSVLQKIPPQGHHNLDDGRPATGKTGTWQLGQTAHNAHAWFVGATKQIATAVWVGNEGAERPILTKGGADIGGAMLPGDIWERYMNAASKGLPIKQFAERHQDMGDDDAGNGISPTPNAPPSDGCLIPLFCPGNGGGPGGGGPGGGGGGGGLPLITPSPTTSWRSRQ